MKRREFLGRTAATAAGLALGSIPKLPIAPRATQALRAADVQRCWDNLQPSPPLHIEFTRQMLEDATFDVEGAIRNLLSAELDRRLAADDRQREIEILYGNGRHLA
jgi:hypothetical protein